MAQCKQECRRCEDRCTHWSNEKGHLHDCGGHPHLTGEQCYITCDSCREQGHRCVCARKGTHLVHDCGKHGVLRNIQAGIPLKAKKKAALMAAYGGAPLEEKFYKKVMAVLKRHDAMCTDSSTDRKLLAMYLTRAFNENKKWKPKWDDNDQSHFEYYECKPK